MLGSIALWILLLLTVAGCGYWHYKQNADIVANLTTRTTNKWLVWIIRLRKTQTLHLLLVLSLYSLLTAAYESELREAREAAAVMEELLLSKEKEHLELQQMIPSITEAARQNALAHLPDEQDDAENAQPSGYSVADLYSPEQTAPGKQSAYDALKRRYEEILVTYFYLRKCNVAPATDYHIITSAISREMASVNAPGRLQYDILTAARGSYNEIYASTSCGGDTMAALHSQYADYINTLSADIPEP